MKPLNKTIILYLEALIVIREPVVMQAMAEKFGVHRQNMGDYFVYWQSISALPIYDKNKKYWRRAKLSKSKLFKTKSDAQDYIDMFECIFDKSAKI